MNGTTWNPETAQAPETPIVEARPLPQDTDTSERVRVGHPGAGDGWSHHGGMVEQQASASKWVDAANELRDLMQEMTDGRHAAQTAQFSRWGDPVGETAGMTQSAGIGQSQ
jgi:hypothetical protein